MKRENRFNLSLLADYIRDEKRDHWLANWQSAIDSGLESLRKPNAGLSDVVWLAGLFNLFREAAPRVIDDRISVINSVGSHRLTGAWEGLRRQRGRSESSESPRRFIAGDRFNQLIDQATYAKQYSKAVDHLLDSAQLLFNQAEELSKQLIANYKQTAPKHRLMGDNLRVSILITWLNYGKLDSDLADDSFCGWRESRGLQFYEFCRHANRLVKQFRGTKRRKGEPSPSWSLCCDSWRSFRYSRYDRTSQTKTPREYERENIARRYLHRLNVIGESTRDIRLAVAYRAYREKGIRQTVINKWLERQGISSVYPRITATDRPQTIEREEGGISVPFYALSCWFDGRFGWIVWREGMSDVIHVTSRSTQIVNSAETAVESAIDAIKRRLEADRQERELAKFRELNRRQQLAQLVRRCRSIPQLRKEDSYSVGNCHPGTEAFVRQLGLGDQEVVDGKDIANRWRKHSYCQQSYFQRVILSFPMNELIVTNAKTE